MCVGAKGAAHSCGHLPFAVVKNLLEIHYCCHHTNLASSDVQCQAGNSPPHRQRVRWRHEGHTQRSPILRLTCRPRPPRDRTCSGLASSMVLFQKTLLKQRVWGSLYNVWCGSAGALLKVGPRSPAWQQRQCQNGMNFILNFKGIKSTIQYSVHVHLLFPKDLNELRW